MAEQTGRIHVQVCFAKSDQQILRDLVVPVGTNLREAIDRSGILIDMPEINLAVNRVGIYGKLKSLDTVLREHDRIEIYRPLVADPKEARRKRAQKKDNQAR